HPVGPPVRHVRAGGGPGGLRAHDEHRHVQPAADRHARVGGHRPGCFQGADVAGSRLAPVARAGGVGPADGGIRGVAPSRVDALFRPAHPLLPPPPPPPLRPPPPPPPPSPLRPPPPPHPLRPLRPPPPPHPLRPPPRSVC